MNKEIGAWILSIFVLLLLIIFVPHIETDINNNTTNENSVTESSPANNPDIIPDNDNLDDSKITYYSYSATKMDAWVFAQDVIKSTLKAPGTANFPFYNEDNISDLSGNRFIVTTYVDAENSFGAEIRNNFIVDLTITGEYDYVINDIVTE